MGYLDPGLFGILSQVGLAVFLIAVSAFTFFSKPIKKVLSRIFKKKSPDQPQSVSDQKNVAD
jgi:dsDNA-binding SOS-regulon protein